MIKLDGTEYRNLQEQVAKNACDIADLKEGKQDALIAGEGISILDGVISADVGTPLYKHSFSGLQSSTAILDYLIDADPTPITDATFLSRVNACLIMKSMSPGSFAGGTVVTFGEMITSFLYAGDTSTIRVTITYRNVSDTVTEL